MSKQSEAKTNQGYAPTGRTCGKCQHYLSYINKDDVFSVEKNKRCGIGGFAVKKMSVCDMWKGKQ